MIYKCQHSHQLLFSDGVGWSTRFTARNMLAAEALTCGFVNKVRKDKESTVESAIRTATLIAEKSPVAVEGTKRNLNFRSGLMFS